MAQSEDVGTASRRGSAEHAKQSGIDEAVHGPLPSEATRSKRSRVVHPVGQWRHDPKASVARSGLADLSFATLFCEVFSTRGHARRSRSHVSKCLAKMFRPKGTLQATHVQSRHKDRQMPHLLPLQSTLLMRGRTSTKPTDKRT